MNTEFDEAVERPLFEKWALSIHHSIEKSKNFDGDTIYNSGNTQGKWSAWLAARRLAHEENARLCEALKCVEVLLWGPTDAVPMSSRITGAKRIIADALAPKEGNRDATE